MPLCLFLSLSLTLTLSLFGCLALQRTASININFLNKVPGTGLDPNLNSTWKQNLRIYLFITAKNTESRFLLWFVFQRRPSSEKDEVCALEKHSQSVRRLIDDDSTIYAHKEYIHLPVKIIENVWVSYVISFRRRDALP